MSELVFDCTNAGTDPYAAAPTLVFRLRIAETTGQPIGGISLRVQFRIEPLKRRYVDAEADRLLDLFGERSRWGDTMKPMQFAMVSQMVPPFSGSIEVDVPVPVTYDFEVATAKYFHGLEDGEIPFIILFSGTTFLTRVDRSRSSRSPGTRRRSSGCRCPCGERRWTRTSPTAPGSG